MWEISVGGQATAFACSAVLGAILGFVYDIIRATRKVGLNSFAAVFIGDMLFWIISAVAVFMFLMAVTNGEIRGYILFSCLSGFIIYLLTLGRAVSFLFFNIFSLLAKWTRAASGFIGGVCVTVEHFANSIIKTAAGGIRRILSRLKKLLKNIRDLLYTDKNKEVTELDVDEQ